MDMMDPQGDADTWEILHEILANGRAPLTSLDYVLTSLRRDFPKPQGNLLNMSRESYYLMEPKIDPSRFGHNTLLIFVQSSPERVEQRERIRESWGNIKYYHRSRHRTPIQVIFTMGLPTDIYSPGVSSGLDGVLLEESLANDILFLNILDTYNSLAYKGLLTMLWVINKSPRINYIFKTDDDVLINTFAWINLINSLERYGVTCSMVGHVWQNPEVLRQGKYKEMIREYEYDVYPSFCSGAGYLMSRATMVTVLEASFHLPILKRDDPFYTGIIPRQTDIHLLSIPWSSYGLSWGDNRNLSLFAHSPTIEDWYFAWKDFRRDYSRGLRREVILEDRTDRNTSLPKTWMLPEANHTLRHSCIPKKTFKAFRVKL